MVSNPWQLKAGDHVEVTVRDGRRVSFTVARVDASGIVDDNKTRYEATDILVVKRRQFSLWKTSLLGLGTFVSFLVAVAASMVSAHQ